MAGIVQSKRKADSKDSLLSSKGKANKKTYSLIPSKRKANENESLFLSKLPGEMRNKIYRLVLVSDQEIDIYSNSLRRQRSLLKTCHQIREEASTTYFGDNSFTLPKMGRCYKINKLLGAEGAAVGHMLSKLIVAFNPTEEQTVCALAIATTYSSAIGVLHQPAELLHRSLLADGTKIVRILVNAGVPLSAITFSLPEEHKWPEQMKDKVPAICDILDAQLATVVKEFDKDEIGSGG